MHVIFSFLFISAQPPVWWSEYIHLDVWAIISYTRLLLEAIIIVTGVIVSSAPWVLMVGVDYGC